MPSINCLKNEFLDNVTVSTSVAGSTCLTSITNSDNSDTASKATLSISTGGSTGGDPFIQFTNNVATWSIGIDNSVSDQLTFSASNALGTSNTAYSTSGGIWHYPLQCAFNAHLDTTALNVTGNGAAYSPVFNVEKMDIGGNYDAATGIFIAPVTGRYMFSTVGYFDGCTKARNFIAKVTTSNRDYIITGFRCETPNPGSAGGSTLADMDAGDTTYIIFYGFNESGNTDDFIATGEINRNHFAGALIT